MVCRTGRRLFYVPSATSNSQTNGNPVKSALLSVVRSATDLLFPPRCVHCGADGSLFCDTCEAASTRLRPSEVCRTCALPARGGTCEKCFDEPPSLNRAVAVFTYQPEIRDAITALKYRDIRAIAPRLAELMLDAMPDPARSPVDRLVPVPISRSRSRSRGYNQSGLLAKRVSAASGIRLSSDLLVRTNDNGPQARSGSIEQRAANVRDAFEVPDDVADKPDGQRILLIDDVMTTGSTLNACATALKDAGAAWVGALVLAREL